MMPPLIIVMFYLVFGTGSNGISAAADKPNIIVVFTDDHCCADLSCQGVFDDVKTPNIDPMA